MMRLVETVNRFGDWLSASLAQLSLELAVVEAYGDWADGRAAAAYADSLTRVAEMKCSLTRRLLVNTFAAAESNFRRRVRRILRGRAGRMTLGLSVMTVAALIAIACMGLPTAAVRQKEVEPGTGKRVLLDSVVSTFTRLSEELERVDLCQRAAMFNHLVCMQAAGWDAFDYSDVMVISGCSALFAYPPKDERDVSLIAPADAEERIARATGFGWEWVVCKSTEDAWDIVKQSLDAGKPVRLRHRDDVLVAGYEQALLKHNRKLFVLGKLFGKPGRWWTWQEFETWFSEFDRRIGRHTQRLEAAPPRDTALDVMKNLVAWCDKPPATDDPQFAGVTFGFWGMEAYAADVADTAKTMESQTRDSKDTCYFNRLGGYDAIVPQVRTKGCTARYLRRIADLFEPISRDHLKGAADNYSKALHTWCVWRWRTGRGQNLSFDEDWMDVTRRHDAAAAVRTAISYERSALSQLAFVLRREGIEVPNVAHSAGKKIVISGPSTHPPLKLPDMAKMKAGEWGEEGPDGYRCRIVGPANTIRAGDKVKVFFEVQNKRAPHIVKHMAYDLRVHDEGADKLSPRERLITSGGSCNMIAGKDARFPTVREMSKASMLNITEPEKYVNDKPYSGGGLWVETGGTFYELSSGYWIFREPGTFPIGLVVEVKSEPDSAITCPDFIVNVLADGPSSEQTNANSLEASTR